MRLKSNPRLHDGPNYAINLTACGSFLLAHGIGDGRTQVELFEPPAAGDAKRWAGSQDTET
jgi:hypothetical protein